MNIENKQTLSKAEKIIQERLDYLEKILKGDKEIFFENHFEEYQKLKEAIKNLNELNKYYK